MTTTIKFDGLVLTGNGNMVNFPGGFATVLNKPVSTINTPSRISAIVIIDDLNSAQFPGIYNIFGGTGPTFPQRDVYNLVKAKESTIGILIFNEGEANEIQIPQALLKAVSLPSPLGGGALSCSLVFEKVAT